MANGYQYELSNETRSVLTDNAKVIAEAMGVTTNYIHQILSNNETDVFSKFLRLYTACVKAGVDVTPWMASLSSIKAHAVDMDLQDATAEKIKCDASTTCKIIKAAKDGEIDEREAEAIRQDLQKERAILDVIDQALPAGNIRAFAKTAVGKRVRQA
jgi:transcriptional regulator with XRE-family HTH domain